VPTVLKSGSLNLLEPSGPVQACNGIALPLNELFVQVSFSGKLPSGENRSTIDPQMTATVMYASHLANGM